MGWGLYEAEVVVFVTGPWLLSSVKVVHRTFMGWWWLRWDMVGQGWGLALGSMEASGVDC